MCGEVRGQPTHVSSFLPPCAFSDQTQAGRFGGKHPYPMGHLTSPRVFSEILWGTNGCLGQFNGIKGAM